MRVWTYDSEDGAATAARVLPDAAAVRRGVVTWRDGWKHPHISVRESRGIGEVARDYLQGFVGMGMGSSRGTAYAGVDDVLLEHVMDTHIADELEDALRPGTSAIVVVAEDRAEASPVVDAVTGSDTLLWDRELGQDEQVLRS